MTIEQFTIQVNKLKEQADKRVNTLKNDADTDAELAELSYYHGQQVAINQVVAWIKLLVQ